MEEREKWGEIGGKWGEMRGNRGATGPRRPGMAWGGTQAAYYPLNHPWGYPIFLPIAKIFPIYPNSIAFGKAPRRGERDSLFLSCSGGKAA